MANSNPSVLLQLARRPPPGNDAASGALLPGVAVPLVAARVERARRCAVASPFPERRSLLCKVGRSGFNLGFTRGFHLRLETVRNRAVQG